MSHRPEPRHPRFDFSELPRHWFAGAPGLTHVANGLNLIFPHGERFFVRSVKHYLDELDDPELEAQVRGFFGQEGSHAREHEAFFRRLEAQGYDVQSFLRFYTRSARWLEDHLPPALNLSITAAAEHFTASLGEHALTDGVLDEAHPVMRNLLRWHAAEEIEHKAVAYDVLMRVQPSYANRMLGLGLGTVLLVGYWVIASVMLVRQEKASSERHPRGRSDMLRQRRRVIRGVFWRSIQSYVRRDFHPMDHDNLHLAEAEIEAMAEYLTPARRAA